MQNMYKWLGLPSDEWAFLSFEGFRDPITRAVLAFFLDKGLLGPFAAVYHMSEDTPQGTATLGEYVRHWKAESQKHLGDCLMHACKLDAVLRDARRNASGSSQSMSVVQSQLYRLANLSRLAVNQECDGCRP